MRIWYRRPLFSFCSAFLLASALAWVFAGTDASARVLPGIVCLACACFLLCLSVVLRLLARRASGRERLTPPGKQNLVYGLPARCVRLSACLIAAVLALLASGLYFGNQPVLPCPTPETQAVGETATADGDTGTDGEDATAPLTVTVEGVITACRYAGGQLSSFDMTVRSLNGSPVGSAVYPCRAVVTCYYIADFRPGNVIRLTAEYLSTEDVAEDADDRIRLIGDGFSFGLCSMTEEDWVLLEEKDASLSTRGILLRETAAARLEVTVGKAAGGLPSTLLLGERSSLENTLRRDFARAGASHMLAISGLHMTLLFGMLAWLLRLLRVPKRVRSVLLLLSCAAYLFLLGFPPSATRAAIMLGAVYLADLLSDRADSLTALGVAGFLILTLSPSAVCDAGFWMSFSSAFGLVAVMPVLSGLTEHRGQISGKVKHPRLLRLLGGLKKLAIALGAGLVAMTFSLWITGISVGSFSLASPVVTLLLTPLCGCVLLLSLLCLPLYGTWVGQSLLAPLIRAVCGWMISLTHTVGQPSWIVVLLRHPAVVPVALCTVAVTLLLLGIRLPKRARGTVLLPLLSGWLILGCILTVSAHAAQSDLSVTYLRPSSVSDELVLVNRGGAVICDVSDGSASSQRAALRAAEDAGATEISTLVLTHYHSRLPGAIQRTLGSYTVRLLLLPCPDDDEDYWLMQTCLDVAADAGVPVRMYEAGEPLDVAGAQLTVCTAYISRSTQPLVCITLTAGEERMTYLGGAFFESRFYETAEAAFCDSTVVICGTHGPKAHKPFGVSPGERLSLVVFADESLSRLCTSELAAPGKVSVTADVTDGVRFTLTLPDP